MQCIDKLEQENECLEKMKKCPNMMLMIQMRMLKKQEEALAVMNTDDDKPVHMLHMEQGKEREKLFQM